jgi:NCS1 family nucleobase:cation symporter-1
MMALIALVVGVLPNLPGFLHVAGTLDSQPTFFLSIYSYAWFVGLFISGAVYLLLMRNRWNAWPAHLD